MTAQSAVARAKASQTYIAGLGVSGALLAAAAVAFLFLRAAPTPPPATAASAGTAVTTTPEFDEDEPEIPGPPPDGGGNRRRGSAPADNTDPLSRTLAGVGQQVADLGPAVGQVVAGLPGALQGAVEAVDRTLNHGVPTLLNRLAPPPQTQAQTETPGG